VPQPGATYDSSGVRRPGGRPTETL